jgi:glyoxylase-like metal-dependent hydrolase (beta-lactamase superfamily II)
MPGLKAAILPVTPFEQNCALLWDEEAKRATVVDPGGDVDRIMAAVAKLGVTVERILLTHGHTDHAGDAAALKEALGGAVEIVGPAEQDRFLLDALPEQGARFGLDCRAVTPDRWLVEGDRVTIAGIEFDVYHCPGHTPGHVVFVAPAAGVAVVGDVLFRGSVGRTDFPYGDYEALIRSIRQKLFPLGDHIAFLCGHGPGSTFGAERRSNPFVGESA